MQKSNLRVWGNPTCLIQRSILLFVLTHLSIVHGEIPETGSSPARPLTPEDYAEVEKVRIQTANLRTPPVPGSLPNATPLGKALEAWDTPSPEETILKALRQEKISLQELKPNGEWIKTQEKLGDRVDTKGFSPEISQWLKTEKGITALHVATLLKQHQAMKSLLAAGHPKNVVTKNWSWSPLRVAAANSDNTGAKILLGIPEDPTHPANRIRLRVNLEAQEVYMEEKQEGIWQETFQAEVSTGKRKFETPKGVFFVSDKHTVRTSNLYHVDMPFFMRLSLSAVGIHQGSLPGFAASHGCIRTSGKSAKKLFSMVPVGTEVIVQ